MLKVEILPLLSDNYAFLLSDADTGACGVVDPSEAAPVMAHLRGHHRNLELILATHHHGDHVGGILELKRLTGARVIGPEAERGRIPGIDRGVREGEEIVFGDDAFSVIETPGHTRGHVSFYGKAAKALFCADTLFALGCGKLLEGDAPTMWRSLQKLAALPDDTLVYCGHEYTASNARFALTIEPGNAALQARAREVERKRAAGEPTVPSTIGEEKATNPFLRAGEAGVREGLGFGNAPDEEVFAEIRRRKDGFRG